jgi:hypothetical protein
VVRFSITLTLDLFFSLSTKKIVTRARVYANNAFVASRVVYCMPYRAQRIYCLSRLARHCFATSKLCNTDSSDYKERTHG